MRNNYLYIQTQFVVQIQKICSANQTPIMEIENRLLGLLQNPSGGCHHLGRLLKAEPQSLLQANIIQKYYPKRSYHQKYYPEKACN